MRAAGSPMKARSRSSRLSLPVRTMKSSLLLYSVGMPFFSFSRWPLCGSGLIELFGPAAQLYMALNLLRDEEGVGFVDHGFP